MKALHFSVHDYDLRKTLESGQTFHWDQVSENSWEGMIAGRWIRLSQFRPDRITAQGVHGIGEVKEEIVQFLQLDVDIRSVIKGFPDDPLMRAAVQARTGLRLLRQDPWVCLASLLLSSNKDARSNLADTFLTALVNLASSKTFFAPFVAPLPVPLPLPLSFLPLLTLGKKILFLICSAIFLPRHS